MLRASYALGVDPAVQGGHRGMIYMTGFVVLWAAVEALAAGVLARHSPYQVVWTRYAIHLALMLLIWGRHDPARLWRTRRVGYQMARSLLMLGMPASWVIAVQLGMPTDTIMAVFWLSPLMILALSWLLLHERTHAALWVATGVALCGVYLLHIPAHLEPVRLLAFPLSMAACFSLYVVMTRNLRDETAHVSLFYSALGVFLMLTPAMAWLWRTPTAVDALIMAGVGVLGFFALWLLEKAASAAPVSASVPFLYLQVAVFAVIAAVGGLGNDHSPRRMAVGILLIAAAAFYVWLRVQHLVEADGAPEHKGESAPKES